MICSEIAERYERMIKDVTNIQRTEFREAIFFVYEDGSTTDIFKGKETSISLSRSEQKRIMSGGDITASIHTHPTGFDLSTIDIMTGIMTQQDNMCVAVPVEGNPSDEEFVLSCLDLSNINEIEKQRLFRAMRRSSVGISNIGRLMRKEFNLYRFDVDGCRTVSVE